MTRLMPGAWHSPVSPSPAGSWRRCLPGRQGRVQPAPGRLQGVGDGEPYASGLGEVQKAGSWPPHCLA